jgi:hypothetical protein
MTTQVNTVVVGGGRDIADRLAKRPEVAEEEHATAIVLLQSASQEPKRSCETTRWADRVMTLI